MMITLVYRDPHAGVFTDAYSRHLALVCQVSPWPDEKLMALTLLRENSMLVEKRRTEFWRKHSGTSLVIEDDEDH